MEASVGARESLSRLACRHAASAAQPAADAGASRPAVARLLSKFAKMELVERAETRLTGRRRPRQRYRLLVPAPFAVVLLNAAQVLPRPAAGFPFPAKEQRA